MTMLLYQVRLALLSLRRNPVLSVLLVAAIALGIGISSAIVTVLYLFAGNPIPDKSDRLFYVEIDSWSPDRPFDDDHPERPPSQLTYRDAVALSKSEIPTYSTIMFKTSLTVHPEAEGAGQAGRPYRAAVRLCTGGFFPMFEVPFLYGGGWTRAADQAPEPVVVIDAETNRKLFGGANSVGRSLRIEDRRYTVVGVIGTWRPVPKYFDTHNGPMHELEAIYLPFAFVRELEVYAEGNIFGWKKSDGNTFADFLLSENVWIQMWAQLDSPSQRRAFHDFLDAYVLEQQQLGRCLRPRNNRLLDVMTWLQEEEVVPAEMLGIVVIALLFLVVCSVNLIGILLGKFLARAPEVGVRRALGASRLSIFLQHLVECEMVGVLGGLLGLVLSMGVLGFINRVLDEGTPLALDLNMVLAGLALSLGAGLIAGIYPAWRICRVAPAAHLKLQ